MTLSRVFSLFILSCLLVCLVPFLGSESIQLSEIGLRESLSYRIFWELRLPRLLLTFSLGGLLALLGSIYQSLFKNPLCEPYILGVSSAVILGLITAELFFKSATGMPTSVFLGMGFSFILISLLMLFASSRFGTSERVVLFGLGANFILSSALFVLLSIQNQSVGGGTLKWFFGFLPWFNLRESFFVAAGAIISLIFSLLFSRTLEVLRLGDTVSRTLGVSPRLTRGLILLSTSLVVACTVTISGTIGFVGLVVPHLSRLLGRPGNFRALLLISFLMGAVFLSLSDALSRSVFPPFEFPVGIMTTLLGGPFFLLVLWKRR